VRRRGPDWDLPAALIGDTAAGISGDQVVDPWRTLNAATQCQGCHGSMRYPPVSAAASNGGGPDPTPPTAWSTPRAYASNVERTGGNMAATSRFAAAARPK